MSDHTRKNVKNNIYKYISIIPIYNTCIAVFARNYFLIIFNTTELSEGVK